MPFAIVFFSTETVYVLHKNRNHKYNHCRTLFLSDAMILPEPGLFDRTTYLSTTSFLSAETSVLFGLNAANDIPNAMNVITMPKIKDGSVITFIGLHPCY